MRYQCVFQLLLIAVAGVPGLGQSVPGKPSRVTTQKGGGCPDPQEDFEKLRRYRVRSIRFETSFDFLGAVKGALEQAKAQLPQKEGQPFVDVSVTQGTQVIQKVLGTHQAGIGLPVNITAAVASIEDCQAEAKTLEVVYRIFTSRFPFFSSRVLEAKELESRDPPEGAGMTDKRCCRFQPRFGYNSSAKTFGGAQFVVQNQGPIDALRFEGQGSAQSLRGEGALEGGWGPGANWLQQLEWRAFYGYTDLPADQGRLKKNLAGGQVSLLLRDFGRGGPLLRAGLAMEAGTQASRLDASVLPAGVLTAADYSGIKAYLGTTFRGRRQSLAFSYGLKIASAGQGFARGFRKHVGDLAYNIRWLPEPHRPLELEVRSTVGSIENLGAVPVTERFFGGNVQENFLQGGAWRIRSNPVIRSFGQNRLDRVEPGPAIGGEDFLALNLTFTPTVWKKPLVPQELLDNPGFERKLNGALKGIEQSLVLEYESRDPLVGQALRMKSQIEQIQGGVEEILTAFEAVEETVMDRGNSQVQGRFAECLNELLGAAEGEIPLALGDKQSQAGVALWKLVRPEGTIDLIAGCVRDSRFGQILGQEIDPALRRVTEARHPIREVLSRVNRNEAAERASRDLLFTRRVLDSFLREINLASIAPVIFLDAARLGPRPNSAGAGFRYGIGAGIRLSLVSTAHLTLAYGFNPDRQPWENRGALTVSLDVADLFY